jgi:hypothetical protein
VCGLACSRVEFLQLWEDTGPEREEPSGAGWEGGTEWTWRQGLCSTWRGDRTRLWVCGGAASLPPGAPTPPRLRPGDGEASLSPSPSPASSPSPSPALRGGPSRIEVALAKFDLLEHLVAIHRCSTGGSPAFPSLF